MVIQILVQDLSVLLSNRLYTFLNAGIIICTFVETYALPLVYIKWILVATKYISLVANGRGNHKVGGDSSSESQSSKVYYYKYSLELVTSQVRFVNRTTGVKRISNGCRSQMSLVIERDKNFSWCQLSYCGQDCSKIPYTLCKMYGAKVHCLDMSYNKIESLKGLECFASLEELILDNNQLGDGLTLPHMPLLKTLSLNNNQITELELLLDKVSERLPQLTYLSLLGNRACPDRLSDLQQDDSDYQRYRYFVLHKLPGLRFLDWRRVSAAEWREARTRGVFMRVRRPPPPPLAQAPNARLEAGSQRPLPVDFGALGKHKGAYGKCNYTYTGKHSEGNRFIGNSDL